MAVNDSRIYVDHEADHWADLVEQLLPRVLACDTAEEMEKQREHRAECALQLAAAALRAAGEHTLAENLLS